jgi:hypothetical protein
VALGGATDGGVARHLADAVEIHREQQRAAADSRGGERGLASRVTGADDDHVPGLHDAT